MKRYTMRPENPNEKVFRIVVYGAIGVMLILLAISRTRWVGLTDTISHSLGWTGVGLLFLFLAGVVVLIYKESVWQFWQKASYDLGDQEVSRILENSPPIVIPLAQISFLGESRYGLIVRGIEPSKSFLIPRSIDGFEELKWKLSTYCEIKPVDMKTAYRPALPLILVIVAYAFLFSSKITSVVLVAGVVALLLQAWVILSMRKVWARTRSPRLVMLALLACWLILVWFVYQRVSATS